MIVLLVWLKDLGQIAQLVQTEKLLAMDNVLLVAMSFLSAVSVHPVAVLSVWLILTY
jgi:hypothetical protein